MADDGTRIPRRDIIKLRGGLWWTRMNGSSVENAWVSGHMHHASH